MHSRTNNILVPVDFSDESLTAIEQSYNLAKLTKSDITLLHVNNTNLSIWNLFTDKEKTEFESRVAAKLTNLAEEVSNKSGLNVNTIIEKGKLVDTIVSVTNKLNSRLLIIGAKKRDIKQRLIGSNISRIIKESECPVITIRGKHHRNGCDNILLPLDLTKETKQKINLAIQLGKFYESTIHIVTVTGEKDFFKTNKLETQLKQVQEEIESHDIKCTSRYIELSSGTNDKIAEALLEYAQDILADLIMIMTQQERDVKQLFIGSLATQLIHHSEIPIMSCIPKED